MKRVAEPVTAGPRRRQLLAGGVALAFGGLARAVPGSTVVLVAAWADARNRHHVGLVQTDGAAARVLDAIEVPTRPHGLACLPAGGVLAVARRPGDWLLRWQPGAATAPVWAWADADRRFNGHVLAAPDGGAIYTAEIELASGAGRLVERDPRSLAETAIWPTHGLDPHDLEWLPGRRLLVANGGIPTLPETGRSKRSLDRMDPSLVRLDLSTGAVDGQWRLADPRLSIRHLARHPDGRVGVALQAEHESPAERAAAPLFALFDDAMGTLQTVPAVRSASGYGADVAPLQDGWLLSCPREHQVQRPTAQGGVAPPVMLDAACALAVDPRAQQAWILGRATLCRADAGLPIAALAAGDQFDNHAVLWSGAGPVS